jgi:hypothetical protein
MEFFAHDFVGLKAAVDQGREEKVSIEGKGHFWVRQVTQKADGETIMAELTSVNDTIA